MVTQYKSSGNRQENGAHYPVQQNRPLAQPSNCLIIGQGQGDEDIPTRIDDTGCQSHDTFLRLNCLGSDELAKQGKKKCGDLGVEEGNAKALSEAASAA